MRFGDIQYLEKNPATVSIRNNNASLAILDGQPVYYDNNDVVAVNFGVDVKTLSTALGTSPVGLFAGIAKINSNTGLLVGEVGEAICYGFTDAIISRRTRAASTDTWASVASFGAGDQLIGDSVNNGLLWKNALPAPEAIPAGSTGQTVTLPTPLFMVGAQSQDTLPTRASTYLGTALNDTYRMKVFVRAM